MTNLTRMYQKKFVISTHISLVTGHHGDVFALKVGVIVHEAALYNVLHVYFGPCAVCHPWDLS